MDKIQTQIKALQQRLQASTTTNFISDRLRWALDTLGAKIAPEKVVDYECAIIETADSLQQCRTCNKSGAATLECYRVTLVWDNGILRRQTSNCKKAMAYANSVRMARLLGNTRLGRRFLQRRFDTFEVNNCNRAAYETCRRFCDTFSPSNSTGLLLTGGYGTGKTHLAAAILAEMASKGIAGEFVVVPDLLQAIRRSFGDRDNKYLQELFNAIKSAPVLVLDDLGAEKPSDWVREQLFMFINARYENMLSTVITSNRSLSELADEETLGQRIISRIVEMTEGVLIKAGDYRMRKLGSDKAHEEQIRTV